MLKIGEFSKLSHLTVKALRFYEKEGLLLPASVDERTGYRFYETSQLARAAQIQAYRQLDFSIDEIKALLSGTDVRLILLKKVRSLSAQKEEIDVRLSILNHILEKKEVKYQVTEKTIPSTIVYTAETVLKKYSDAMQWIPSLGESCKKLNPDVRRAEPPYEFCEYLDGEYRETDIRIRHSEAVTKKGVGNDRITFREIPETTVLSLYHAGAYDAIGGAYAFIMNYAEKNGYTVADLARERYIDGIWNKETPDEWITEIQLPIIK